MKKILSLSILNKLALVLLLAGAVGSLYFVLHTGRNNKSVLLVGLFVIWVLSPFLALMVANVVSRSWSSSTRRTLYGLMLFVTFGSLVSYTGVLSPVGTKPAAVFLLVPLISWLLIAIIIPIALSRSKARINN